MWPAATLYRRVRPGKTLFLDLADRILSYHFDLQPDWQLPEGIEVLYPYASEQTRTLMRAFYRKYYKDELPRVGLFGINPGRFGAGITGIPFTDPVKLEEAAGIPNPFNPRPELSADFVYRVKDRFGGLAGFCRRFYISSLCPLGFVKDGRNYNFYDSRALERAATPFILDHLRAQIDLGVSPRVALCLGKGKNMRFFDRLNAEHHLFEEIVALPHPRWVMQYRRRRVEEFTDLYVEALEAAAEKGLG